jgi:hypothetical protein
MLKSWKHNSLQWKYGEFSINIVLFIRPWLLSEAVFLKMLKHMLEGLTGENSPVTSLHWLEQLPRNTWWLCGQVATSIALFEFNNEDKVIHYYSLLDSDIVCVPNYLESMKVA